MRTKLLLLLLLANLSYAQTNLVPNGGFESWVAGLPQNWTVANSVSSNIDKAEGQYSAKLSLTDKTLLPKVTTQVLLKAGVTYTVKFKYKYVNNNYSGLHPITLKIFQNGSGTNTSNSTFATNNNWTQKETTFTPDMDLSYDLSISAFSLDDETFDVLIDDVAVIDPNEPAAQYTLIPDFNFEKKLISLGIDSGTPDGKVLTADISGVKILSLTNSSISDLTGIEDFTSLTDLYAGKNQLTSINLSKNTKLLYLDVGNNQLTSLNTKSNVLLTSLVCHENQITSLDVSKNVLLEELMCHYNNLTAIDVSLNPELYMLDCLYNQITSVDISKNPKITELACENNQLTYLNLKNGNNVNLDLTYSNFVNNPNLTCIEVDDVDYANTNWSAIKDSTANYNIDCTPYTLIPDLNFEKKLIALGIDSGNPDGKVMTSKISSITNLDLYNSNIIDLKGIEGFQSLTNLNCMSNKITTLDVSKNLALTNLNTGYNKLTNLNTSKNTNLQYLLLSYNEIVSLDLSQNINLILLACNSNKLTNIDLSSNKKLSTLWCPSNQLTNLDLSKNALLISILCSENKLLTSINLRNGNNTRALLNLYNIDFTKNPALTCILVDDAIFSNEKWENFKDPSASYSTADCSQVTTITDPVFEDKLIAMNIDTDGKNGSVLNTSIVNITSLDVSSSSIKDLTGIKGFTSLTNLNCSGNLLTFLDLSKNTSLTIVNSSNNKLLNLNLKNGNNLNFDLSSNFKNNPDLNCIQVDDETLSTNNWSTIKDAVASYSLDCNVYTLIPDSNFEDKLIALEIDKDGKNGKVLTSSINKVIQLDISSTNISDLTGIQDFTSLTSLDCKYNKISTIDVSNNKSLRYLALHDNKLTSLNVTQNVNLFNLIFSKNQISTIDLSHNKDLHYLSCDNNLLSNLDISSNTQIESLWCGQNNLTTLDVSNQPNLLQLNCIYTTISVLDVSSNPKLEMLYFNDTKLTTIDLSNNPLLKYINLSNNLLTTLDLSHNPLLELVFLEFNPLTSLNLQNGNNEKFILPSSNTTGKKSSTIDACSFLNNKKLSCIQVDNVGFSNANWTKIKDPSASYSAACSLGIEHSVFDKITIYPNPTKGELNIQNVNLEKANVYNTLGQLVKSFTLNSSNTDNTVNLSGLPKGVYYVYLINQDAASAKKVIVE